jgi:hypothetical protein
MNGSTIKAEMTLQEYYACRELLYPGSYRIVIWALLGIGAAFLASSAALTWGTPASILAGLALATFIFTLLLIRQIAAPRSQRAYERYKESNTSYTFTSERILATSRYAQSSFAWAAVHRVIETSTLYLLAVGNSFICIPKRDIPPHNVGGFIQLLKAQVA